MGPWGELFLRVPPSAAFEALVIKRYDEYQFYETQAVSTPEGARSGEPALTIANIWINAS